MARNVIASSEVVVITLPVITEVETTIITEKKATGAMACYVAKMDGSDKVLDGVVVSDWPCDTSSATDTYCASYIFQ